jgi:hypothetical protein
MFELFVDVLRSQYGIEVFRPEVSIFNTPRIKPSLFLKFFDVFISPAMLRCCANVILYLQVYFLLFNDLVAFGSKVDDSALYKAFGFRSSHQSAPSPGAAQSSSDRFTIRFKAPLLECLVIDDLAVYGKEGRLKLREDTPMASAMMEVRM